MNRTTQLPGQFITVLTASFEKNDQKQAFLVVIFKRDMHRPCVRQYRMYEDSPLYGNVNKIK